MSSPGTDPFVYDFDAPPALPRDDLNRLLGGKGGNLVVMANELQLPVPPGFIVTTEACRAYLGGSWPDGLDAQLRKHMERLGSRLGRRFDDPADPLLVSVRSGAPVSMPGMMDTILNLGLNEETVKGLARQSGAEFAADCLRRFRDSYRSVIGDADVPTDPWQQLRNAIEGVFRSWNSDRAKAYRAHEGIPDDLGTAVTVQAMVFGNRGEQSGTGVLFTRNPSTGENAPYGDIMFNAQGEDVVAGTHAPSPIAVLDTRLPTVATELRRHADMLERHYRDLCDIEFTIDDGRLWMLQVRAGKRSPRAALRMAIDMASDEQFPLTREDAVRRVAALLVDPPRVFVRDADSPAPIARGLPASPGVATGRVVTSSDEAERASTDGGPVILVRDETSPEDVRGMAKSAGVLTARGGLASHAAVVARGWGIPAVVGASEVRLLEDGAGVDIADRTLRVHDTVSIDGSTGEIFADEVTGKWEVAPEAATLLVWADELGIDPGEMSAAPAAAARATAPAVAARDAAAPPGARAESVSEITEDDVVRALAVKGGATVEQLGEQMLADDAMLEPLVRQLVSRGVAENADEQVRLSATGKLDAAELFSADRNKIGEQRASAMLDEFHVLDARMKKLVTAWQLRDAAGEQVLNDHSDANYDAKVLDELGALHRDTVAWLALLSSDFRRYAVYSARLERALGLARTDARFVASPRVGSYHSVWFELHEDLIRLSGKKRADVA